MTDVATILRTARKSKNLTQAELSRRTGIFQGDVSRYEKGSKPSFSTVDRLLAASGHRLFSAPTRRDDAATITPEITKRLKVNDRVGALRALIQINDNLVAEKGLVRGILGFTEPETTNEPVWDAAIAGLVAWRLSEEGIPVPEWVESPNRFLTTKQDLAVDVADVVPPEGEVPEEFLKRGVLVWRDTFMSV